MHHEISWGWDPTLKHGILFSFKYIYAHCLKVIFAVFLVSLYFDCVPSHEVRCGIFHLTASCQCSESFGFSEQDRSTVKVPKWKDFVMIQ